MVEYAKLHLSLDGEPFPVEWAQMQGNFGDALEEWGARQCRIARLSQVPPRRITRQGVRSPLHSTERWNDVFGEQFDLAHLLVHRHETLVEEPTEPFEFALAADLVKRRYLGLDLVDRSGQRIFDLAHALQSPLGGRQRSERVRRILVQVLRRTKRLPETETPEIVVEAGVVGVAQQLDRFRFSLAEMHGAKGAHILA